jgi:rhodanese-related sulfurtransferase
VENCAVAQKHVIINSTLEKLQTALQSIDTKKIIQQTVDTIKVYNIKKEEHLQLLFKAKKPTGFDKIIYLSKNEDDLLPGAENINFNDAWNNFFEWEKTQKYLLVCETGAKSRLLAQFMKENNFQAEGIGKSEYHKSFISST